MMGFASPEILFGLEREIGEISLIMKKK